MEMDLSLEDFLELSEEEQLPYIGDRAVLYAQQFDRPALDELCAVADRCRALAKSPGGAARMAEILRYRMALNFFVQPSSRTFMSFNTAQACLGLNRMSVRDLAISSMSKGESLVDSVRTFISYVDLVVMRHSDELAAPAAFWTATKAHRRITLPDGRVVPVPIINAGSGTRQHPTQALLDVYTLQRSLRRVGGLDGKTLLLAGDLKRGRTVRSLSMLMTQYPGVSLLFAAPERYQMLPDITDALDRAGVSWRPLDNLVDGLPLADAVYMTRIQDEWDKLDRKGFVRADHRFVFRKEHLDLLRPHAPLLHPLPKRDELDPALDYVDDDRVAYWRQERNGMWMRVGLLLRLFGALQALDEAEAATRA
ncbi:MAG: aspartate carbamoyltransferase [Deltaproteobacteria bacterium]|nr:MAG: aspartate carbamoyltransferase [Deltaproteobacteria bacterium]